MFLVCGLVTIALGVLVLVFLPDNPMKSKLPTSSKTRAIERLRENKTGVENKSFKIKQMWEALTDYRVIILCILFMLSSEVNGAMGNYQATLIKSFGYTSKQSALFSIPLGLLGLISIMIVTYIAGRFGQRLLVITCICPIAITGSAMTAYVPVRGAKLAGIFLLELVPITPLIYTVAVANINALILMSFAVGNIIGPLTFTGNTVPKYIPAKIAIMASFSCVMITALTLRTILLWENRRRDKCGLREHAANSDFMNMTDRKNDKFR
ncbi:hypothetical protein BP5796_01264 [Coleophoma crateriformis]|uniref:Major facilitator superfamily (MFS) profile domain-containing protein n=1 Tax=Coleophoma crateriformis TaxID=565419 RepID=A0A3D8T013_9HELO|nr:hypothetical protein BP5796_01264 [Coleophoma crateriformis]